MRVVAALAVCTISVCMAGCGASRQMKEAQAQAEYAQWRLAKAQSDVQSCLPPPGMTKSHVDTAECVNAAIESGYRDAGFPYMDLVLSVDASRLRIAEAVDRKKISAIEGQAELSDKMAAMFQEVHQRTLEDMQASANIRAADEQARTARQERWIRLMESIQRISQPYGQGTVTTSSCSAMGTMVNCMGVTH